MEKIEYKRLYEREKFYWWNIGRRRILESVLRQYVLRRDNNILDLGCGAGGNFLFLKNFGQVTGLDVSAEALRFSEDKGFVALVAGDAESLQFPNGSFGVIASLDVIEHIPDDRKALREIFRVLGSGGILLLTVPAHMWLWSRHDEALHHRRRYEDGELMTKLREVGFSVLYKSHFVIPSIPFLLLQKFVRKLKLFLGVRDTVDTYDVELPSFLNNMLLWWLKLERLVMGFMPLPVGSSLLVIAQKK